jgi:hypothetical protein
MFFYFLTIYNRKLQDTSVTIVLTTDSIPQQLAWLLFDSKEGTLTKQVLVGTYITLDAVETVILSVMEGNFTPCS